jgi:hypothetical protein
MEWHQSNIEAVKKWFMVYQEIKQVGNIDNRNPLYDISEPWKHL